MTRSIFRSPRITRQVHEPEHSINASAAFGRSDALDRRRGDRQTVLKSASIVFNGGHCTLSCHILDVSDTGARVRPSDVFLCPGEFTLRPRVGAARACEVVWRRNDKVGVRYI